MAVTIDVPGGDGDPIVVELPQREGEGISDINTARDAAIVAVEAAAGPLAVAAIADAVEDTTTAGGDFYEAVQDGIDTLNAALNSDLIRFESWTLLNANPGTVNGQGATVHGPDTGTHTDPVVGGTVNNTGLYRWSSSPAGWKWLSHLQSTYTVDLFPAGHNVAYDKISWLRIYSGNPLKFYRISYFFYWDVGTRFNITIAQADDESGTNSVDVCKRTVSSGASYTGLNKLTIPETGSSGISAEVVIDFGNGTTAFNAPYDATYAQAGLPPDVCLAHDTDYVNDLITTAVEATALQRAGLKLPFVDYLADSGSWSGSNYLQQLIRNIWVYGADPTHDYIVSYIEVQSTRRRIQIKDLTTGVTVAQWLEATTGVTDYTTMPRFIKGERGALDITTWLGTYFVAEIDWSVATTGEGPYSTMTQAGLDSSVIYADEGLADFPHRDEFHEIIPVGAARTYTTLRDAVEDLYLSASTKVCNRAHYHHQILIKLDPGTYEATDLVIPEWVSIQGSGRDVTFIEPENTDHHALLQFHLSGKVMDLTILSNTGDGGSWVGEYCIHTDDVGINSWGGENGLRTIRQGFKRLRLVGGTLQNSNLIGGGISQGQHILCEDVVCDRLNASANAADLSCHNTAPNGSYPTVSEFKKPALWEVRNCASNNMVGAGLQVISLGADADVNSTLVLDACNFNLVRQAITAGTRNEWTIIGVHSGAVRQTDDATDTTFPDTGFNRKMRNTTGSTLMAGRFVKRSGADTVSYAGVGENVWGWLPEDIANGALGTVVTTRNIASAYIDDADTSTGLWGLAANGLLSFSATTKIGLVYGSVVQVGL